MWLAALYRCGLLGMQARSIRWPVAWWWSALVRPQSLSTTSTNYPSTTQLCFCWGDQVHPTIVRRPSKKRPILFARPAKRLNLRQTHFAVNFCSGPATTRLCISTGSGRIGWRGQGTHLRQSRSESASIGSRSQAISGRTSQWSLCVRRERTCGPSVAIWPSRWGPVR